MTVHRDFGEPMGGNPKGFLVLLAAVAFFSSTADGAPGEGVLEFHPPGRVQGMDETSLTPNSFLAVYGTKGDAIADVRVVGSIQLTKRVITEEFVSFGPNNWGSVGAPEDKNETVIAGAGRIESLGPLENLTLALAFEDDLHIGAPSIEVAAPLKDPYVSTPGWVAGPTTVEPYSPHASFFPNRQTWMAPGLRNHLQVAAVDVAHHGNISLLISGMEVQIQNETGPHTIRTGSWIEPAPDDPTGLTATVRVRWHHTVLFGSAEGSLNLSYRGAYGHVLPREASIWNATLVSVPLANSRLEIGGEDHAFRNKSFLDIRGRFDLELDPPNESSLTSSTLTAKIQGEIQSIAENRVATSGFDSKAAVLTAGATLALGGLLASLTPAGRELIGFVTGRNATTPLAHPLRVHLLRLISENPGITQSQLAASAGISLWLARYHLRILRRGAVIDVVRTGSTDSFLLNGGSFRFYLTADAGEAEPRKILVAAAMAQLHHPVRRGIYEALRERGASSYGEIQAAWSRVSSTRAPSARLVTYHARLMQRAGLLRRERRGKTVAWSLAVDVNDFLLKRAEECMSDPVARRVYEHLVAHPGLKRSQVLSLPQGEIKFVGGVAAVGEALARLERGGFILRNPDEDTFIPTTRNRLNERRPATA